MMSKITREEKIYKYENYLNEQLRTDLSDVLSRREIIQQSLNEYKTLREALEKILDLYQKELAEKSSKTNASPELVKNNVRIRTKVDLGCNFYAQADVTNVEMTILDIGCGIWLPMTSSDALKFCDSKLNYYNNKIATLTQLEHKIKAKIDIVIQGLKEIQNIRHF